MSDDLILASLAKVKYPGFSRDIVSFGLIQKATLNESGKAFVKLELGSSDPTVPQTLKKEIEKTLLEEESIREIEVQVVLKSQKGQPRSGGSENERSSTMGKVKKIVAIASGERRRGKIDRCGQFVMRLGKASFLRRERGENRPDGLRRLRAFGSSFDRGRRTASKRS